MNTSLQQDNQVNETQEEIKREEENRKNMTLVFLVYLLMFTTNLFANVDHGVMPAATVEIKRDLGIENAMIGVMGGLVYLGLVAGKSLYCQVRLPPCRFSTSATLSSCYAPALF